MIGDIYHIEATFSNDIQKMCHNIDGAINALVSRVLEIFIKYNSCIA